MDKIYYSIWRVDTTFNESYFCESFDNEKEAKKAMKWRNKVEAKFQPKELRDTYIIRPLSEQENIEQEKLRADLEVDFKAKLKEEKAKELSYNAQHLDECIELLLKKQTKKCLKYSLSKPKKKGTLFKCSIKWKNDEDCFTKIKLENRKYSSDNDLRINLEIYMREGEHFGKCYISQQIYRVPSIKHLQKWSISKKGRKICLDNVMEIIRKRLEEDKF
ncbi:MAG: hypothetical protein R3Y50_09770 [Rikenellaceae bacterium]